jgi:hypothetical protein
VDAAFLRPLPLVNVSRCFAGPSISACAFGSLALLFPPDESANGSLATFGANDVGRLGHGSAALTVPAPTLVSGLAGVRILAMGFSSTSTYAIGGVRLS